MLRAGQDAVTYAVSVRTYHAKRTRRGSNQREADIQMALDRLKSAMRPIRSEIASYPFKPLREASADDREKMQGMSKAIQKERRKLWKMRTRA